MAQTYPNSTNVLSKVKFGNVTYYLKDSDVRSILDTFGNVVTENKATTIADGATGLVNADQVYDFVTDQIGALGEALDLLPDTDHTAVTTPQAGNLVVEADGSEWLYDGTGWREIGSENAYVLKTFTIAGIDMQDNIAASELQTALGLKALAYKDNGSVKVTTVDSMNQFSTGKAGQYSVTASTVSVPETYNSMDVTPAGSVTITAGTAAAATYDKTSGVSISSAQAADASSANYTPTGNVTVSNIAATTSAATVAKVTNSGESYALTDGSVNQGSDSTSNFTTEGIVAAIDSTDTEMLVLTNASTSAAVTASGAVTYTAPVLSGSLPTFGSESVLTGITGITADASFSGDGAVISATPNYTATSATVVQPTYTAAFEGTDKSVTPTVKTTLSAAGTDGSVTVSSENITPTYNATEKTINVTFGVNT